MAEGSRFRSRLLVISFLAPIAAAQTTQGLIFGRVTDDVDRQPLHASVFAIHEESGARFDALPDNSGFFVFPLVPPGRYTVSAELEPYRPARFENLEVPVGGYVEQNVSLRLLSDLWQRQFARRSYSRDNQTVLLFYGPDVDTSRSEFVDTADTVHGDVAPSLSYVVGPALIESLPLSGRDVYQLIALQPGVTSDLATLRGVGVSVNGQRPSSGSFLLDGLDNNNYLISGPYSPLPPEAIADYRISTNNFSAEYGRTSGYLANAATRAGGEQWHGLGYAHLMNEALNANDAGRKQRNQQRLPLRDFQQGFRMGGPLLRNRLFEFGLLEYWRQQSWGDDVKFNFPTPAFIDSLPPSSVAVPLLRQFPPPVSNGEGHLTERPPTLTNRVIVLNRVDWTQDRDRIYGRLNVERMWDPDFIWSPYTAFNSALKQNATSGVATHTRAWTPAITSELRAGLARDLLGWNQAHPEIPQLSAPGVTLPGSLARYFFNNHGASGEVSGNLLLNAKRQFLKMGGGILLRATNSTFTPPSSAESFAFSSLAQFAADEPSRVTFPAARDAAMAGRYAAAQTERQYRYSQEFLFVEDSVRVGERFLLHVGVRYDSLGAPLNTGAEKDWRIQLNSGASLPQKLTGATLPSPGFGSQQLYNRDGNDWAPRAGFAWNLRREGGTILRGSYGIFYDQPFDNLWQNLRFNNSVPATAVLSARPLDYLHTPLSTMLSGVAVTGSLQLLPLTLYQPGIRTPYVQSFFMELEQRISANMLLRAAYAGSIGRKLLTTDLVNRVGSTHPYFACPASDGSCRYSEILDNDVDYRANQGTSEYHAAIVSMDYRSRWGELHASYTLSHSIDNQSDPLLGGLSASLEVTNLTPGLVTPRPSEFTEQFNSSIDRASSDFDQRHSFVFYSVWKLPAIKRRGWLSFLTRDWSVSQLGAVRSGLPYTIYASGSLNTISASGAPGVLKYNRADVVPSVPLGLNTGPYADGQRLVNPNSFADPLNQLGNLGRNALKGPGLFNVDLSISRSWPLHLLGESARLSIRADAYNAFNHANLNNPSPDRVAVGAHNFAVAQYGRVEGMSQLFAAGPLNESARRIQMMLRISF